MPEGIIVRHALAADVEALEQALAVAFLDDPVVNYLVGEPDAALRLGRSIEVFFRFSVAAGLRRGHLYTACDESGACVGAAVWSPPDVPMFDDGEIGAWIEVLGGVLGEAGLARFQTLAETVLSQHPEAPHFYLGTLGAVERGNGLGPRLMARVLDVCDRESLPSYLESSNPRNIGFYERHGYRTTWESTITDGVLLTGMWRDAAPAGAG
jgi:GNAT superfamily N-acetyltransferase